MISTTAFKSDKKEEQEREKKFGFRAARSIAAVPCGATIQMILVAILAFSLQTSASQQLPLSLDGGNLLLADNEIGDVTRTLYSGAPPARLPHYSALDLLVAQQQQLSGATENDHHTGSPGHYEFEVAPKMEPPNARRPPFKQTGQVCPGADVFGGYSPRDTLCGDLNQGKVPLNPLGQSVTDQAYPFELIKNKTLQFLARALPVLKSEYDVIPKVARYLPANQLLNPTSHSSPLGLEHFHELNQQFVGAEAGVTAPPPPPSSLRYLRRRRRSPAPVNRQASITVAEMSPNASLVVSSAHSGGRIRSVDGASSSSSGVTGPFAMITKDGYRPIGSTGTQLQLWQRQAAAQFVKPAPQPQQSANENNGGKTNASITSSNNQNKATAAAGHAQIVHENHTKSQQQQQQQQNGSSATDEQPTYRTAARNHATQASVAAETARDGVNHLHSSVLPVMPAAPTSAPSPGGSLNQQETTTTGSQAQASGAQRKRPPCSDVGGPILSTVCQTATALIEGEKAPTWVRVLREVGNMYAASSPDTLSSASPSPSSGLSSPIWSLWSSLSGGSSGHADPDASPAPLASLTTGSSGDSGGSRLKSAVPAQTPASPLQTMSNILSLLGPLTGYFSSGLQRDSSTSVTRSSGSPAAGASVSGAQKAAKQPGGTSSTMAKLSNYLLATTALAGLVDYFAPSLLGSSPSPLASILGALEPPARAAHQSAFAKRKNMADNLIDTPASLAALSAANKQPGQTASVAIGKQPPTPCPSVEEYISPTFARNYQGAWKYVVQIPHEGYFTQTIQRSSCLRQKCEFTEGVCHEAPRWVSLLVAEIYYPNAIFGTSSVLPGAQQPISTDQLLSSAPSSHQVSFQQASTQRLGANSALGPSFGVATQDPLQMTDSLSNYNHNLNNFLSAQATGEQYAMLTAAANRYQRTGMQAQAGPEARVSEQQPVQQQFTYHDQAGRAHTQQPFNDEYIKALAIETLRRNPHLSLDELIKSMQLSSAAAASVKARKKRDLQQQQQPQQQQHTRPHFYSQPIPSHNQILQQQQVAESRVDHAQQMAGYNDPASASQPNDQHAAQASSSSTTVAEATKPSNSQSSFGATSTTGSDRNQLSGAASGSGSAASSQQPAVECDGYDKIGCFVVRVYYDWFLVNGSCKCWKTNLPGSSSTTQSSSSGSSGGFIRRIFTG